MTERSMLWDGEILGDCGPYNQSHLMDCMFRALLNGTGNQGVLFGWLGNLQVSGTTSPLTVAAGAGVVYGMFYENTAAVSVTIASMTSVPSITPTRTDLIVVRRSWVDQTCRIVVIQGPGAALVQVVGTTYDIPLASVEINTSDVITVTDTRDYSTFSTEYPALTVDTEHYGAGAVTVAKIPNRTRWESKGAGEIEPHGSAIYGSVWTGSGGLYGAAYDHWQMRDGITDAMWCYFMVPPGATSLDFYVWSVPDTNGLGAGAENVHWDCFVYAADVTAASFVEVTNTTTLVDQQARVEANIYADQLVTAAAIGEGFVVVVRVDRAGAMLDDTYFSPIRLLAIEMRYTADS